MMQQDELEIPPAPDAPEIPGAPEAPPAPDISMDTTTTPDEPPSCWKSIPRSTWDKPWSAWSKEDKTTFARCSSMLFDDLARENNALIQQHKEQADAFHARVKNDIIRLYVERVKAYKAKLRAYKVNPSDDGKKEVDAFYATLKGVWKQLAELQLLDAQEQARENRAALQACRYPVLDGVNRGRKRVTPFKLETCDPKARPATDSIIYDPVTDTLISCCGVPGAALQRPVADASSALVSVDACPSSENVKSIDYLPLVYQQKLAKICDTCPPGYKRIGDYCLRLDLAKQVELYMSDPTKARGDRNDVEALGSLFRVPVARAYELPFIEQAMISAYNSLRINDAEIKAQGEKIVKDREDSVIKYNEEQRKLLFPRI
jgi:hypothetical protein